MEKKPGTTSGGWQTSILQAFQFTRFELISDVYIGIKTGKGLLLSHFLVTFDTSSKFKAAGEVAYIWFEPKTKQ